jgi:hypothetical protein
MVEHMKYLLFLACAACGGSFSSDPPAPDAGRDAPLRTMLPDAAHEEDHTDPTDAAPDRALLDAPPGDVHTPPDAPVDHVAPVDAPPPPADAACIPFGVATVLCPGGIGSTTPGQYCVYESTEGTSEVATTPAACQCASTYTCACLESSVTVPSDLCASGQIYAGCMMVDDAPLVTCETP